MKQIHVQRKTTESEINVVFDFSPIKPDYRKRIDTTIPFLNHMIEHIAWRGGVNIEASVKLDEYLLSHVICEDLGIAMGRAAAEYIHQSQDKGVVGFGDGIGIIDEAKATCAMSFETRTYFEIDYHGITMPEKIEGMYTEDIQTFLEGFAQGACCTLHIDLLKGENGHHIWEAIFRSFGVTLNCVFFCDPLRAGMTSGVAGNISWDIKILDK